MAVDTTKHNATRMVVARAAIVIMDDSKVIMQQQNQVQVVVSYVCVTLSGGSSGCHGPDVASCELIFSQSWLEKRK
jgi:hypothetical protein